ncbi:MAG: AraC family transcriptional regulator [Victivallaceae bacterium]|nr:AraC family transcriptional regulator [Victivallaceae bacterium]
MNEIAYFPKKLPFTDIPQMLGINCHNDTYRLIIETFHLNTEIGYTRKQRAHRHDVFHAVLYRDGNNSFQYQGSEKLCVPGTLALAAPGELHSFAPCRPGKVRYHEITFSLRNNQGQYLRCSFSELFGYYFSTAVDLRQLPWQLDITTATDIEQRYWQLEMLLRSQVAANPPTLYRQLHKLLMTIYDCGHQSPATAISSINSSVMRAKSYIEQHLRDNPNLTQIAKHAGVAPEYLCREFKRATGYSPIVYRDIQRIVAAKRMLRYSERSIKEIAELLGFADVYYFSRVFKKIAGLPPGKYRARHLVAKSCHFGDTCVKRKTK